MKLATNASVNFERYTQREVQKLQAIHDEHDPSIHHSNDTINQDDTELNSAVHLVDINNALQEQYGAWIDEKNAKLKAQYEAGKISKNRYRERRTTIDKYLNKEGKGPKKAFTRAVVYCGGEKDTKAKLDALGFEYEIQKVKSKQDGEIHTRFHLTDPEQRQQWKKMWTNAFKEEAKAINTDVKGFTITDIAVHLDEGSPHAHYTIVNQGHTASGKPSYNLNAAFKQFAHSFATLPGNANYVAGLNKGPKGGIRLANDLMSRMAVEYLSRELKDTGLQPTYQPGDGAGTHLSPAQYKAQKAAHDELADVYEHVTGLSSKDKSMSKLSDGVTDAVKKAQQLADNQADRLSQLQAQTTALQQQTKTRDEELERKRKELQRRERQLKQRERQLEEYADDDKMQTINDMSKIIHEQGNELAAYRALTTGDVKDEHGFNRINAAPNKPDVWITMGSQLRGKLIKEAYSKAKERVQQVFERLGKRLFNTDTEYREKPQQQPQQPQQQQPRPQRKENEASL